MSEQIEEYIDSVLIFMNDTIEKIGSTIKTYEFEFNPGQPEFVEFTDSTSMSREVLEQVLRICCARNLIEIHSRDFRSVWLTEEGQGRGLSAKLGKNRSYELSAAMQITTLNIHGQAQVGNGNVQNFNNIFLQIKQQIEEYDAPVDQKEEVKGLIQRLMSHPLFCAIVGGIAGGVTGNVK